jgi:hypothetical protein
VRTAGRVIPTIGRGAETSSSGERSDWHSAIEMHDEHLAPDRIAVEAAYFETHRAFKRPYGWGWALMLADEVERRDDPGSRRRAAALEPLAAVLERRFLEWLPKATYPQREWAHGNSAWEPPEPTSSRRPWPRRN